MSAFSKTLSTYDAFLVIHLPGLGLVLLLLLADLVAVLLGDLFAGLLAHGGHARRVGDLLFAFSQTFLESIV